MKKKKIVVIGSSNTDLVIKTTRIPSPGETVIGGEFLMTAGGKGANQAVAIARLGGDVAFIAKVGRDMFGESALRGYAADGIDTDTIERDGSAPSGVALITVDAHGENCIVVAPGANNTLTTADIDRHRDLICSAEYLLMQLEIPMEVVEYAAEMAEAHGVKVILNPAPAAPLSRHLMRKLYLITPNLGESQLITGVKIDHPAEVERVAEVLLEMGAKAAIITLGSDGALIRTHTECDLINAEKVVAIDTTAAGDVFSGALVVALSEGKSLVDAARFATHAAAISVTRMGAQSSIPYRKDF
ncbi:MAG: ribokinase [Rikenellaceae bacterium]|nr:ribokinase [Rikenellaceae bacterium]